MSNVFQLLPSSPSASAWLAPGPRIATALVLKLLAMPLLMAALCAWLEASPLVSAFAILCAAMPSSPSGYLVAKQLGGDSELMATIITFQTLVSMVTVTLWGTYAVSLLGTGP